MNKWNTIWKPYLNLCTFTENLSVPHAWTPVPWPWFNFFFLLLQYFSINADSGRFLRFLHNFSFTHLFPFKGAGSLHPRQVVKEKGQGHTNYVELNLNILTHVNKNVMWRGYQLPWLYCQEVMFVAAPASGAQQWLSQSQRWSLLVSRALRRENKDIILLCWWNKIISFH